MAPRSSQPKQPSRAGSGAFTLVESVLATAIVGGLVVASLSVIGAAAATRALSDRYAAGELLARDIVTEMSAQRYADPQAPGNAIGVDAGESQAPARTTLDDVDDYHGLVDKPALARDGSAIAMPGAATWTRRIRVRYINPITLAVSGTDLGVKEINVVVYADSRVVANVLAIKTRVSDGAPK